MSSCSTSAMIACACSRLDVIVCAEAAPTASSSSDEATTTRVVRVSATPRGRYEAMEAWVWLDLRPEGQLGTKTHAVSSDSTAGRSDTPSRALACQRRSGRLSGGSGPDATRSLLATINVGGPRSVRPELVGLPVGRADGAATIDPKMAASATHKAPKLSAPWPSSAKCRNSNASISTSTSSRTGPSTGCAQPRLKRQRSRITSARPYTTCLLDALSSVP